MKALHLIAPALLFASAALAAPKPAPLPAVDIPYEKFVLPNGLTLIVHEDRKAPVVAVNIWYHVGSKDERLGRTGFAHLFEHLMFNGSENYKDDWFKVMEGAGATKMNGTTWYDRTNYFQNVPTSALDMTLWMESDRMGHLLGAIDQAVLDALEAGTTDLFRVTAGGGLVGRTLQDLDLRAAAGAAVIAVVRGEQSNVNPSPELRLEAGDYLVLVGSHDQIERSFIFLDGVESPTG